MHRWRELKSKSSRVQRDWGERVQLSADDPRLKFEIYSLAEGANKKVPILVCGNPCRVMLRRGEYRVRVSGGRPEQVDGDRQIEVVASTRFHFSLPNRSAKNRALAVAITGSALFSTGAMVYFLSLLSVVDCYNCDEGHIERARVGKYVGQGMMLAGVVLAPVGWILFAQNRKPSVEQRALVATRKEVRPTPISIVAAPIPGGAAAGLWGNF